MRKLLIILIIIAPSGALFPQNSKKIICGQELFMHHMENQYPGFKDAVSKTFEQSKQFISASKTSVSSYTVNVVVHVVWKNAAENLHDSIIQSQIDVLNEDFNRMNADSGNLRTLFKPIAAASGIHFNLAQIIRIQTNKTFTMSFSGMPKAMKLTAEGGSDAISPSNFLNIWVCAIQPSLLGQILGFAFPPAGVSNWPANTSAPSAAEDGVVIDYRCFGRYYPNTISIDGQSTLNTKGRTPTHEVGHYFGLRHIWGDGGLFGGSNNCQGEDGIDDTPKANAQSNFDCNTSKNTCVDNALPWTNINAPDMIENFMDYSSELCMNTFTKGQTDHMVSVLLNQRSGLLLSASLPKAQLTKNAVTIYPNPTSDIINISSEKGIDEILILNLIGEVVYSIKENGKYSSINLSQIAKGTYIIKVLTGGEYVSNKITIAN